MAFKVKSVVTKSSEWKVLSIVNSAGYLQALTAVKEWAEDKKYNHGRLHGSIDCEPCAYSDLLSHLQKLQEGVTDTK